MTLLIIALIVLVVLGKLTLGAAALWFGGIIVGVVGIVCLLFLIVGAIIKAINA